MLDNYALLRLMLPRILLALVAIAAVVALIYFVAER